jgi:catechol 2,3-dioxygenase-like lactoylglutathione lyase family enzyme
MAKVTGIGGVFFRSRDPKELSNWYKDQLGIETTDDGFSLMWWRDDENPERREHTVWSPFAADTEYFGPTSNQFMVNYRVDDLDEMLQQLESAGVEIDPKRLDRRP